MNTNDENKDRLLKEANNIITHSGLKLQFLGLCQEFEANPSQYRRGFIVVEDKDIRYMAAFGYKTAYELIGWMEEWKQVVHDTAPVEEEE
jgi:hypothetical protein